MHRLCAKGGEMAGGQAGRAGRADKQAGKGR